MEKGHYAEDATFRSHLLRICASPDKEAVKEAAPMMKHRETLREDRYSADVHMQDDVQKADEMGFSVEQLSAEKVAALNICRADIMRQINEFKHD